MNMIYKLWINTSFFVIELQNNYFPRLVYVIASPESIDTWQLSSVCSKGSE